MTTLQVLRVFVGPDGRGGNPLGVFLDGAAIPAGRRQAVAAELGFSETVFVDDMATGSIRIFLPNTEAAFAGHPAVGTAWLLETVGIPIDALHPPAGEVPIRRDGERTWIRARAEWSPGRDARERARVFRIDLQTRSRRSIHGRRVPSTPARL